MVKKAVICLAAFAAILMFSPAASGQNQDAEGKATSVVVFVCEHGAAKSVVAAAHFNKLARERGLNLRAIARGTNPDEEIARKVILGLQADGLASSEPAPKKISKSDLIDAKRVITFCALPDWYASEAKVESWDGAPPMDEDYGKARDWLVERIDRLLEELKGRN